MSEKLRPKYMVIRTHKGGTSIPGSEMKATDPEDVDSPFVLMPRKDPAAFMAMLSYACHCEPDLALEIKDWLNKIAEAGPKHGTQGTRNHIQMRKTIIRLRLG